MGQKRVTQAYKKDLQGVETTSMYMRPGRGKTLEDMPTDKVMRGMCPRSRKDVAACEKCGAVCTVGRILLERQGNGEVIKAPCMVDIKRSEENKTEAKLLTPQVSRDVYHFAKNLTEAFAASGMTQAQLAERMGSKQCSVSNWLTGRTMPTLPILYGLCTVLNVSADKLLGLEAHV